MPTHPIKIGLLIVASALISACTQQTKEEVQTTVPPTHEPMNCLFIVLDAFHATKSSLYGYPELTTPALEKWSRQGFVFEDATSQFTSTSGSSWSYLNGLYPYRSSPFCPMRDTDVPLAELFENEGYRTGCFSDNPFISKTQKLDKGFSHFEYHYYNMRRSDDKNNSAPLPVNRERSEFLFEQSNNWIQENSSEPWFAYIHTLRPHTPYASPEPYLSKFTDTTIVPEDRDPQEFLMEYERKVVLQFMLEGRGAILDEQWDMLHNMYLSGINYIDHLIDDLLTSLEGAGELDNTMIIITSDHGEAFGEHGSILHGGTPHRPLNHVPLIVIPPKHLNLKPGHITTPVQLVDLLPTLTDIHDLHDTTAREGQSLAPLMRGEQGYRNKAIFSQSAFELAVIKDNRKLILKIQDQIVTPNGKEIVVPTQTELFNLADDPEELRNLYQDGKEYPILMTLKRNYLSNQIEKPSVEIPALPDEEREALEALGYLDK